MLLYVKHYAQMCNRLWAFVPALAYALHRQQRMYVFFAGRKYVDAFPHLKRCGMLRFMLSNDSADPTFLAWRFITFSEKFNLEIKDDLRNLKEVKLLSFVDGWQHRNDVSFIVEQKKKIVKLLRPAEEIVSKVGKYFENYDGMTVGVHIRRGDYKSYLGGKYYFSDECYLRIIDQIRALYDGTKIRFLLCSNEKFNIPEEAKDMFMIEKSDGITDLYALSKCDIIIGPPSSYSQWASFYGDVPLCLILSDKMNVRIDSFSKIVTLDLFEKGKRIRLDEQKQEYFIE